MRLPSVSVRIPSSGVDRFKETTSKTGLADPCLDNSVIRGDGLLAIADNWTYPLSETRDLINVFIETYRIRPRVWFLSTFDA